MNYLWDQVDPYCIMWEILKMYKFIRYLTERLCYMHLVKQIHDSTFSGVGLPLTECSLLWLPYLTKCQPLTVYIDYILDVHWHRHWSQRCSLWVAWFEIWNHFNRKSVHTTCGSKNSYYIKWISFYTDFL